MNSIDRDEIGLAVDGAMETVLGTEWTHTVNPDVGDGKHVKMDVDITLASLKPKNTADADGCVHYLRDLGDALMHELDLAGFKIVKAR